MNGLSAKQLHQKITQVTSQPSIDDIIDTELPVRNSIASCHSSKEVYYYAVQIRNSYCWNKQYAVHKPSDVEKLSCIRVELTATHARKFQLYPQESASAL